MSHHLVDDKMHADLPDLILWWQWPLGGYSSLGGQRFGEMEFAPCTFAS